MTLAESVVSVIGMHMVLARWSVALGALIVLIGCGAPQRDRDPIESATIYTPTRSYATADNPFEPLPLAIGGGPAAKLGKKLYADRIMSVDGTLTCFSCHDVDKGGTDGLPKAHVSSRETGQINTGTIFNLAFNFRFNWNGKFVTLLNHINGPVTGKNVMGMSWPRLLERVQGVDEYQRMFREVYGDGVTIDNIRHAVTEYQLSLVTPNAPFDHYLRGDMTALDKQEVEGYQLFKDLGCASCHQGINIGGNLFARIGVMGNYFADRRNEGRGELADADYGRFLVTKRKADEFVFRVPSLRNVACTGPYFHDGTLDDLEDVVVAMGRYQLGRKLDEEQISLLVTFLKTLTGEHEGRPLCAKTGKGRP